MDDDEFKTYVARTINVLIEAIERLSKQINELEAEVIILAKGSQNKVYMEEALKTLLKNKKDEDKLVRQSKTWLKKKSENFKRV